MGICRQVKRDAGVVHCLEAPFASPSRSVGVRIKIRIRGKRHWIAAAIDFEVVITLDDPGILHW